MYLFFGIFFLILIIFFCLNHWRKKIIICKINCMSYEEKCKIMNQLVAPFGYAYLACQDIFTSRQDAWQREFGYCALYDKEAYHFNLIFDALPIYFNYQDKTWLLELWKGQYGINTGGEIGIYHANRILNESEYKTTLFRSADNENMLDFSFNLFRTGVRIADVDAVHWWLTAFSMGRFSNPSDLCMQASITFPNEDMAYSFMHALMKTGYCSADICVSCHTVSFTFSKSFVHCHFIKRLLIAIAQCMNHFWCSVFLFITRPFCLSLDRLLYLYYYLPFCFRKMLRIRKYRKIYSKRRVC